ncbi:MAG: PEGA domain-containing protein [Nitrosomonas sp.]|nr:PEGA domain-containing protein [Nitrosomonas sp.]
MKKLSRMIMLLIIGTLTGCATIMSTDSHNLPVRSSPNDAAITITDETGAEVYSGKTPTTVVLKKSNGNYFGKKSYKVVISKPGYSTQTIPITASANGWYMFGNLVFGGLIGYLIVDPLSGNMYKLSPENIDATLIASNTSSHNNTTTDGGITVLLKQDIPDYLHGKLQLIH